MADAGVVPRGGGTIGSDKEDGPASVAAVTCSICLQSLNSVTTTLPCGHRFCSDCLEGWWSRYQIQSVNRGCPQCREKVPPTKEMLSQLRFHRKCRGIVQNYLDKPPYRIPPESAENGGDGGTGYDPLIAIQLEQGILPKIRSLPSP
jgi:Zinc finger, C3HC4 type (RING finger)